MGATASGAEAALANLRAAFCSSPVAYFKTNPWAHLQTTCASFTVTPVQGVQSGGQEVSEQQFAVQEQAPSISRVRSLSRQMRRVDPATEPTTKPPPLGTGMRFTSVMGLPAFGQTEG